jgi:hypothetical protein
MFESWILEGFQSEDFGGLSLYFAIYLRYLRTQKINKASLVLKREISSHLPSPLKLSIQTYMTKRAAQCTRLPPAGVYGV